jgi:hypothetical protein
VAHRPDSKNSWKIFLFGGGQHGLGATWYFIVTSLSTLGGIILLAQGNWWGIVMLLVAVFLSFYTALAIRARNF